MNFRNKFLIVFILALVLSFAIFGNGIKGDFVFDDVSVAQNRGDLKDSSNFLNLFVSPYHQNIQKTGLFRPFTMATYSINHLVLGGSAASFHIINIIIHALNSFLVFWLIDRLFKSKKIAYFTFFLFLTHPIHTEAVTSIVGRAELLAFFWSLIAIYFFMARDKLLSSIAFLFALWSKEIAIMVLPIIVYIDWNFLGRKLPKAIKKSLYFGLPLGIYALFRYIALGQYFLGAASTTIVGNHLRFVSFSERIFTALKILSMYIEKLILPINLIADYSYNAIEIVVNIFSSARSLIGLLMFIGLVFLASYSKTRRTPIGLGALLFLAPYFLISNLATTVGTIMGERLMYFPSLGFVLILAYLIVKLGQRFKYAGYVLLAALLVFYGARTIIRNNDWLGSKKLFNATVELSPNSLITRTALAGVSIRSNEWKEAKKQLDIARNIYKDDSHLNNLLGVVADHGGNYDLAEEHYKRALELNPDAINSYINLAELYLKQGRYAEAGESFLKVINFYPTPEYIIRYAYTQITIRNSNGALDIMEKYFGSNLNHPDYSAVVGTAYFVGGNYEEAFVYLQNARQLGSNSLEIDEMINIAEQKI